MERKGQELGGKEEGSLEGEKGWKERMEGTWEGEAGWKGRMEEGS